MSNETEMTQPLSLRCNEKRNSVTVLHIEEKQIKSKNHFHDTQTNMLAQLSLYSMGGSSVSGLFVAWRQKKIYVV